MDKDILKKFEKGKNQIYLNKGLIFIFPYFSYPKESRFINSFNVKKKNLLKKKGKCKIGMEINPDKIISKIENRTSILLKNIPQSLSKESILNMIYLPNYIDYIYIPYDENKKILGFIFINVINPIYILKIIQLMNTFKNKFPFNVNKSCEICFSNLQGSFALYNAFGPSMM